MWLICASMCKNFKLQNPFILWIQNCKILFHLPILFLSRISSFNLNFHFIGINCFTESFYCYPHFGIYSMVTFYFHMCVCVYPIYCGYVQMCVCPYMQIQIYVSISAYVDIIAHISNTFQLTYFSKIFLIFLFLLLYYEQFLSQV